MSNPAPRPVPDVDSRDHDEDDDSFDDDSWDHDLWADDVDEDDDSDDEELVDCWVAHDDPNRPFAFGMWLCDCAGCHRALRDQVARHQRTAMVLKTSRDHLVVTAARLLDASEQGGIDQLCRDPNDHVREIFVGAPILQRLLHAQQEPPSARSRRAP